ncbi:hypothetical protein KXJ72_17805 (plasmid) [Comamonas aquatica]|nr:hypothetical protein KXJ72_17805 [Comamonas aquatica]
MSKAVVLQFKKKIHHKANQSANNGMNLSQFLRVDVDGQLISSYMTAFPVYGRMIKLFGSHIGFGLEVNGNSFLGAAIKSSANDLLQRTELESLENWQASDALVLSFVKSIAKILDWMIYVDTPEGERSVWSVSSQPFGVWLKMTKSKDFNVVSKGIASSEMEVKGLAIRLLCFGVEDEIVARIAEGL